MVVPEGAPVEAHDHLPRRPHKFGKTYHALEALKRAENGVYAGPLRLLALEVHERLNDAGVYCSLFTGQERREVPFATHASSTIEMVSLQERYDVAVIDEIQLIGSSERATRGRGRY